MDLLFSSHSKSLLRASMAILLLACSALTTSCESTPEVLGAEPEGFASAVRALQTGVEELEDAVASTPDWDVDKNAPQSVRGLYELCIARNAKLLEWQAWGRANPYGVKLFDLEIDRLSGRLDLAKPKSGASNVLDNEVRMEAARDEISFHNANARLELLEAYVKARVIHLQFERRARRRAVDDLQAVIATKPASLAYWEHVNLSEEDLSEFQARCAAVENEFTAWRAELDAAEAAKEAAKDN